MDYGKSERITNRIKVYGIVQGVGFRPLVYHIARKYGINGYVRNVGGYVEIIVQTGIEERKQFLDELLKDQESGCEIVKYEVEEIKNETIYEDFIIIQSAVSDEVSVIPPDLPVCQTCQKELYQEENRRYLNPFISCTSCGPRYTILRELPYDRSNTSMEDFELCRACEEEYTTPGDRRHHAQTISCHDCGPSLIYHRYGDNENIVKNQECRDNLEKQGNSQGVQRTNKQALEEAVITLQQGGIIAVKGIGGYHFVCSPYCEDAVVKLRRLKGREEKPFAVMFEHMEAIKEYCVVSEEEEKLLNTKPRPIVLLYQRLQTFAPSVGKGSIYCGVFLPYTPLQLLLTRECGPLIMTSGNFSGRPIIREDEEMLSLKVPDLQGVLYHQRRILRSVDDSVAKIIDRKPQLIRRSRGYVPYPVFIEAEDAGQRAFEHKQEIAIFAAGGDLKAAYCLYQKGAAVVSQYFGDLEEASVYEEYANSVVDLSELLKLHPTMAVCDLHPNYHSVHLSKALGLPLLQVQHHHAHIASVIAEHKLKGRVLGVAFDGTGYGTDGCIWGGEFLLCEKAEYQRVAHLKYTPILGGDSSMRDAAKTAACYLLAAGLEEDAKSIYQNQQLSVIKAAIEHQFNTVLTSSMGRLFDAVTAILGICRENSYEGECGALLEKEAVLAEKNKISPTELTFACSIKDGIMEVDWAPILSELCRQRDLNQRQSLALGFHYAVAEMIVRTCCWQREINQISTIALSGGVFQNTVLTERTLKLLREEGFQVFYNLAVPPNDGGISLGQTYIGLIKG